MTHVKDRMTTNPVICESTDTLTEGARRMRDDDIGNVLVKMDGSFGMVTDRDLVVRAMADDVSPGSRTLGDVATRDVATVGPDDDLNEVVMMMRERKVRRVPVVENGQPVGILSIGDLAIELDAKSALAEISEAAPNN